MADEPAMALADLPREAGGGAAAGPDLVGAGGGAHVGPGRHDQKG